MANKLSFAACHFLYVLRRVRNYSVYAREGTVKPFCRYHVSYRLCIDKKQKNWHLRSPHSYIRSNAHNLVQYDSIRARVYGAFAYHIPLYLDCNKKDTTSDNHVPADMKNNRPGGNGVNGATLSAGGSGFGGKGGVSASTDTSTCNNVYPSSELCKGQISSSGGGAGSYIYATVPVSSSQVFYIKAGRGGVPQIKSCTGTGCEKNELGGGAVSGKGGPGKVKVEFIYGN